MQSPLIKQSAQALLNYRDNISVCPQRAAGVTVLHVTVLPGELSTTEYKGVDTHTPFFVVLTRPSYHFSTWDEGTSLLLSAVSDYYFLIYSQIRWLCYFGWQKRRNYFLVTLSLVKLENTWNTYFKIGINLIKAQYSVDKAAFNLHKIKFRSFCILNCQQLWILRLTL